MQSNIRKWKRKNNVTEVRGDVNLFIFMHQKTGYLLLADVEVKLVYFMLGIRNKVYVT